MVGKGQKGGPSWPGPYEGAPYGRPETYDDTVTIVVPRKSAEDFYYALAMALGGRAGFAGGYYAEWAPGKKGMGPGMTPKGKGSGYDVPMSYGKSSGPKPKR